MAELLKADRTAGALEAAPVLTQSEIDQRVFDLYDEYCHGHIDRREFLQRASALTVGGVSALAMAEALLPRYALAQTISFTDQRIKAKYVTYPSPGGTSGTMRGYLVQPNAPGPFATVLVIHENRGLNPYIEDVARRVATEGFLALALPGWWLPGQRRRRPHAPGRPRPGQAACGHGEQRAFLEIARALHRQARRHRVLLGRRHDQLPGGHARQRSERGRPLLRRRRRDGARAGPQGSTHDPVRRDRRAPQRHVAGLRDRAEGERRPVRDAHVSGHPARLPQHLDAPLPRTFGQAGLGAHDRVLQEASRLRRAEH